MQIEFHADDYGLFPAQSGRILECAENGVLNAVSVMTNSPNMDVLCRQLPKSQMTVAVHLNFMEGKALSGHSSAPLLTDKDGTFCLTFGKLLLHSWLPGRSAWKAQIKQEIRLQIHALQGTMERLGQTACRLDSHAHYHMIPLVFDALMEVIQEEQLPVCYIRIPKEPLKIYWKNRMKIRGWRLINLIKVAVLNMLACRNEAIYKGVLQGQEHKVFLGVMLSGKMCRENVEAILPDALRLAQKQGRGLEILAHPGGVTEEEDLKKLTHPDDVSFLSSPDRLLEKDMLKSLSATATGRSQ